MSWPDAMSTDRLSFSDWGTVYRAPDDPLREENKRLREENRRLREMLSQQMTPKGFVGRKRN